MEHKYHIDHEHGTITITNSFLPHIPQTRRQLINLSHGCEMAFQACVDPTGSQMQVSEDSDVTPWCRSYIVMALQNIPLTTIASNNQFITLIESLTHTGGIAGMCIVQEFNTSGQLHGEIYGVCVAPQARKLGIGNRLMKSVIFAFSPLYTNIWLGVLLDNKYFDQAVALYTRNGFANATLTQEAPSGFKAPAPLVGLTWTRGQTPDPELAYASAKLIQVEYIEKLRTCEVPFVMSEKLANKLREYMNRDREYAGELITVGTVGNRVLIGYNTSTETKGLEPPQYAVLAPLDARLYFHTHPQVCYRHFGCFLGWPSGGDMKLTFVRYVWKNSLMNFVITDEGIYAISMTPSFMIASNAIEDVESICSKIISETILRKFSLVEAGRTHDRVGGEMISQHLTPEQKQQIIERYFRIVSDYTFNKMIDDVAKVYGEDGRLEVLRCLQSHLLPRIINRKVLDFPLFEVSYTPWSAYDTEIGKGIVGRFYRVKDSVMEPCPRETEIIL